MTVRLGHVARAFAEAEHVVETTFRIGDTPLWIKSAVTTDGRITAQRCTGAQPYDIDNLQIDVAPLPGGGTAQRVWAHECHTDRLARVLGLDPFDLRRRNIRRDGVAASVLDTLEARMGWRGPVERGTRALRRGRGVAIGMLDGAAVETIAATGAEVRVDTATGRTRVIRLVTVSAIGGQLDGAVAEDLDLDAGPACDATVAGDALAGLDGSPGFAVAPAIANAIDDAVGVRLMALPFTTATIHRGLHASIGAPLPTTAP
jgi:CO/xanthine dehydrogenase Mo-binding subunit